MLIMEKILNEIILTSTITEVTELLAKSYPESPGFSRHFNNSEDFFIRLAKPFTVPSFPIHHDVSVSLPEEKYKSAIVDFLGQVIPLAPEVFKDLTYFFDPAEIFYPCFYQVFKFKNRLYLYFLRIDLTFRPNDGEIVSRGSNDLTNSYTSRNLFLECDIIPLKEIITNKGKISRFIIQENISQTWIGETGRGYYASGIWIDTDLTKFISKIFIPSRKRTYPYYPFTCKYRTICHSVLDLSPRGRKKHLIYLHHALASAIPVIDEIQQSLKKNSFSEDLPEFIKISKNIPSHWKNAWTELEVEMYLNDRDMKEFLVEF